MSKVLVIDDEKNVRFVLTELLSRKGFSTMEASGGREGIALFGREKPDAVLLDHKMPGMDAFEALREMKRIDPAVPVIIVTAYGDIPTAVEAIKLGAYDFVTKPPDIEALTLTINRAVEKLELEREVQRLSTAVGASFEYILGRSPPIKKVIEKIRQVAMSDFSIIIQGETGTGKSTIAEVIHSLSKRAGGPFIKVDIGVIPETLVESELFGYEKGAFTGADRAKRGYFDIAEAGTIFIDELENMPPAVQAKLLSAVEQKKIYRVGGVKPMPVDVRIMSAVNTDIMGLVREKRFREDLFFRLSEFMITLPPLRERADDIPYLAGKFCREASRELNKPMIGISDGAVELLMRHLWPGNVRELKNVMRRTVLLTNGDTILPGHLDFLISGETCPTEAYSMHPLKEVASIAVKDAENKAIRHALLLSAGNKTKAAYVLQVDYKTLLTKIKHYHIE
ncbi:MAG: sigma-54-dependent Fis family transcriptional regulator [Deltaproteobacteria bacterium]|nr:sigma-54-dependent Fis family transcriptional regulator [Deltaproteobacteria bacterium]